MADWKDGGFTFVVILENSMHETILKNEEDRASVIVVLLLCVCAIGPVKSSSESFLHFFFPTVATSCDQDTDRFVCNTLAFRDMHALTVSCSPSKSCV